MFDFCDQQVIVTGGTRGIGAAITSAFLEAGATVTATYATHTDRARAFQEGSPHRDRLRLACFDVADYAAVEAFFGALDAPPQVVVANAGIRRDRVLGMMPREDWRRVLDVNLDGTYHTLKFAVLAMTRQRYGRIISIVSPAGRDGFAGQTNYAASKAGQIALSRSLAKEVASRNITVNCVSPGFVDTELLADLDDARKQAFLESVPVRRFGTGADVAHAVMFLATREAGYITGTTLEVTGGL